MRGPAESNKIPSSITSAFRRVIEEEGASIQPIAFSMETGQLSGSGYMVDFDGDLDLTKYPLQASDYPVHMCVRGNLTIDQDAFFVIPENGYSVDGDILLKGIWHHAMPVLPGKTLDDQINELVVQSTASIGGRVRRLFKKDDALKKSGSGNPEIIRAETFGSTSRPRNTFDNPGHVQTSIELEDVVCHISVEFQNAHQAGILARALKKRGRLISITESDGKAILSVSPSDLALEEELSVSEIEGTMDDVKEKLKQLGYSESRTERDGFGWLQSCWLKA